MAESMKDFEKELEESYKVMGDGEKDTDTLLAWEKIKELYENQETLDVTVSGIVNKGVIALVEGGRFKSMAWQRAESPHYHSRR